MSLKKMSYRQLEQQIIKNRHIIRTTKDAQLKRALIAANHNMINEMDNRWNNTTSK